MLRRCLRKTSGCRDTDLFTFVHTGLCAHGKLSLHARKFQRWSPGLGTAGGHGLPEVGTLVPQIGDSNIGSRKFQRWSPGLGTARGRGLPEVGTLVPRIGDSKGSRTPGSWNAGPPDWGQQGVTDSRLSHAASPWEHAWGHGLPAVEMLSPGLGTRMGS